LKFKEFTANDDMFKEIISNYFLSKSNKITSQNKNLDYECSISSLSQINHFFFVEELK